MARHIVGLGICVSVALSPAHSESRPPTNRSVEWTGVNIAGAEFDTDAIPGRHGHDYVYPDSDTIAYFASKGMNIIRVPVLWERIQRKVGADIEPEHAERIAAVVRLAAARRMRVIIDVHNYARYADAVIGTPNTPLSALGNLWRQIAARFNDNDSVIFGLMNEPHGLRTETWLEAVNMAIAEIRRVGAGNLILVPGNGWSSARTWVTRGLTSRNYGSLNGKVMLNVVDPANNYIYEVHQYFNRDWTGTKPDCQSVDIGIRTLTPFTLWARENRKRGFLGEFGVGSSPTCLAALERVLKFMAENNDVWQGWTYWAGGRLWDTEYFTSIQPLKGKDRPQMSVLEKFTRSSPSLREEDK
jgi:endoglucanase